ncbi:MAG TPA: tRNA (N6-threonylcarbamoyladenosine(37)-N6)-methyltransferase TrmO [Methanobacterium sp.]|nr:tRNA (N6-threonylcarbamoyladenosine(37)-N6)-methyltransferase TrmO [Methanobacterium sp.]
MKLKPIGVINSPYKKRGDAPRQGRQTDVISEIIVFKEYLEGLDGVEDHKYFFIIYGLHKAEEYELKVVPAGGNEKRGLFSTRAPVRPNPIALCLVELIELKDDVLKVKWLDAIDGSPLLDIKPFWKEIDCI